MDYAETDDNAEVCLILREGWFNHACVPCLCPAKVGLRTDPVPLWREAGTGETPPLRRLGESNPYHL